MRKRKEMFLCGKKGNGERLLLSFFPAHIFSGQLLLFSGKDIFGDGLLSYNITQMSLVLCRNSKVFTLGEES